MAYLSPTEHSLRERTRKTGAWNWRLIFVLGANTLGWLLAAAAIWHVLDI